MRADRARATRQAVVETAGRLYAERGYVATSIDDVAAAAGVGRATVFNAVGGKGKLLAEAYRYAVRGDDTETPLGRQARAKRILAEPDPRALLEGYASVCAEIGKSLGPLYESVRAAANSDSDARELWNVMSDERRAGCSRVIAALAERGALRTDLGREMAADVLWALSDPDLHGKLVGRRGWSPTRFRDWLTEAMQRELLS